MAQRTRRRVPARGGAPLRSGCAYAAGVAANAFLPARGGEEEGRAGAFTDPVLQRCDDRRRAFGRDAARRDSRSGRDRRALGDRCLTVTPGHERFHRSQSRIRSRRTSPSVSSLAGSHPRCDGCLPPRREGSRSCAAPGSISARCCRSSSPPGHAESASCTSSWRRFASRPGSRLRLSSSC